MHARRWILAAPTAVLVVMGAACGGDDDDASDATTAETAAAATETTAEPVTTAAESTAAETTAPASGEPQEFVVMVDGRTDQYNGSFFGYFPDTVQVHPGDRILYHSMFTGEPHSVTFGSAVDEVVIGFMEMTPEQLSGEAPPPPELDAAFALIPAMLPDGPGDANQNSVNPCFVAEGDEIPTDVAAQCPETDVSPFTGTETFYNSGFLPDGESFVVELAEDIPPGTYHAFCTLHFVEMISTIEVVAADEAVPTPDEVLAAGQEQFEALVALGVPALEAAEASATPAHVHAGVGTEESTQVLVTEFIPENLTAAVGEPVTITMNGPHTVSFNAPEDARTLLAKGDDGGFHLVEAALVPAGFEAPPVDTEPVSTGPPESTEPVSTGPPEEQPPPPIDAGEWNGTGFFNSGIMFGGDFILRFTQPGTYEYVCLIHPEMQGTVTVT
jgi:plastocyanin